MLKISKKWQEFSPQKGVTMEIRPMATVHYHRVMALLAKQQNLEGMDEKRAMGLAGDPDVLDVIADVVPSYVQNIKGIRLETDEGEADITPQDMVSEGALFVLALGVMAQLATITKLTEEELKN